MYKELRLVTVNSGWGRSSIRGVVGVFFIGLLASCTENTVPANAVLDITPRSHSVQIIEWLDDNGGCVYAPENFMDIPLVLQFTTVNGSPIGESSILVYADFSENTYPGYPVLGLYDDLNSNGVIDSDTELVSGFDDNIAEVRTGKYNGAKTLLLRVNLSCSFRGEIRAIAGGISGAAVIEVNGSST
ncbi:hypothetical protein N9850_01410 [Granulosicoccus sp.]|nr:hypothetical protein [Granulosicoccus sp.]MDB4222400.1 hypothetical protein [Granulosicoccus sp.]